MAEQIPYELISKHEADHGHDILTEFSEMWAVSKLQAAIIIRDVNLIKGAYSWVHLHIFLDEYINKNK